MIRRSTPAALALLLAVVVCLFLRNPPVTSTPGASRGVRSAGSQERIPDEVFSGFARWMEAARGKSAESSPGLWQEGERLALERREMMLRLMKENPREALRRAVSWAEYQRLPAELRAQVEEPFSMDGNWNVFPACGTNADPSCTVSVKKGGVLQEWSVTPWGRLRGMQTKENTPLQGIRLAAVAAVHDRVLTELSAADSAATAALFPEGQENPQTSLLTGAALPDNSITVLAGGRRFHFANAAEVAVAEEKLAALDRLPGPHAGSRVLLQASAAGNAAGGAPFWEMLARDAEFQASAWTESPKSMLVILVDFSDLPNAPVDQNLLVSNINTVTKTTIEKMSYGKTTVTATAAGTLVRMPSPTTTYKPSNNSLLFSDAVAAAQAAGVVTSGYDIICVTFGNLGMQGSGVTYAGLAGGSQMWLQNNTSSGVITHELGHNYGIGHASYWQTSNGTVAGTGSSVEYGDPFDVMGSGPVPEGHFHPQGKRLLNWLTAADVTTVSSSGTYRVGRIDHESATGVRGLTTSKGADEAYWIGYRRSFAGNANLERGAYVTWERPGENRTWLLDMTPGSSGGATDAPLLLGKTYADTTASVYITPVAQGGSGSGEYLDVVINRGPFPGNAAPTATLTGPANPPPRTTVLYSVSAADANNDSLSYFWEFGDGSILSDTPTVAKTFLVGGSYTARVTVSDRKGGTVQKTLAVTVTDPAIQWTARTSGTTANLNDITAAGPRLVAVGESNGTILTSPDGAAWTVVPQVPPNSRQNVYFYGVAWTGSLHIAAGMNYDFAIPGWVGSIWTSPDASTWTERLKSGVELNDVASSGTVHVAVGNNGTIRRSTDGTTWNAVASGVTKTLRGVAYGGGVFVAVGFDGTNGAVSVLRSVDGLSWTDAGAGAGVESWQDLRSIAWTNQSFVSSGWYSKVRKSSDLGLSWIATGQADVYDTPAITYGNGLYFAAGVNRSNSAADVDLFSVDGVNWSATAPGAISDRTAAAFFGNTIVTVGAAGSIRQSGIISNPSGWQFWAAAHFPAGGPASGPDADPDNDGATNATEYAVGTHPLNPASVPAVGASTEAGALTLTLTRAAVVPDVTYLVETSANLAPGSWTTAGTTVTVNSPTQLKVRLDAPISAISRAFLRFRARIWE